MGLLDFLLFGAFLNSLRNNNQGNNNPSIAMMIMIAATVVTAILIVTISLISNYQPNYIKPMSNGI